MDAIHKLVCWWEHLEGRNFLNTTNQSQNLLKLCTKLPLSNIAFACLWFRLWADIGKTLPKQLLARNSVLLFESSIMQKNPGIYPGRHLIPPWHTYFFNFANKSSGKKVPLLTSFIQRHGYTDQRSVDPNTNRGGQGIFISSVAGTTTFWDYPFVI